ncbi:c-type cytochrome [Chitinophaga niabensis]|uniref:Cytochrome c n=1 Tax=Chitinophaga niabensis TaxID=536979 RepID=A0A1N6IZL8_9BACT|nr:cytochrome c [Chitinophaga niabensis]SIO37316.1 cytochrome c [Chitinophaga niabensis]
MRYLLIVFAFAACNEPVRFNLGRAATAAEIKAWDIDVRPDGTGLPEGSGTVRTGREIYAAKCALCHGKTGIEGPYNVLVGAIDDTTRAKTIGNYWPYATTLFDYTRRAMPYNQPGSLTDSEVYSITAFLLHANKIIDSTTEMNKRTLPAIVMPARKHFVNDDRQGGPEVK